MNHLYINESSLYHNLSLSSLTPILKQIFAVTLGTSLILALNLIQYILSLSKNVRPWKKNYVVNNFAQYLFSSQTLMNDIPLQHKGIQISTEAFCGSSPRRGQGGLSHEQDPADGDEHIHWDRLTHLYNADLAGPATWSSSLPESLSSLTLDLYTSSAGSPSSGPEGVGTMGICESRWCVCVCTWHKRRWPHVTWKETGESCLNWSQLEGPQCWRSCTFLLTATGVKFSCPRHRGKKNSVWGFPAFCPTDQII